MKILEKATLKDGTQIQLEDWREHNTEKYPNLYGLVIACYPIAKNTSKWKWVEGGRKFRLDISTNQYKNYTNDNVRSDYECLKNGTKILQDLSAHFYNGQKDMWYLGMDVQDMGY